MDANRELESFSYSVSHDLRAPLRAIDGYARMIMRKHGDTFDDETKGRFNLIRENAGVMGKLIDDLLAFSRLGRNELKSAAIDMRKTLESTWEELQEAHPHRRMTLKIGDFPPGWGDPALIRQVLVNLLSNAVKFTRGREEALVEAGTCTKDGATAYYVRDNGAGFDMRYADKLFNVFQRLHSADEFEGTGVGLAIVHRIVKRHGGRVWADGEVDRGARFCFSLPARDA
jgi:two-component system sensor kinase